MQKEAVPDQSAEQAISQFYTDLYAQKFDRALADIKDLKPDSSNREGQAVVSAMRAVAQLGLKHDSEAKRLIARVHELAPKEPMATATLFEGGLIADRIDVAADAIDELIARYPDAMRAEGLELVQFFLRNEPKGQERRNEDRRVALVRLGYGADSETGGYLAADAVEFLVKRGDVAGATELLRYVDDPQKIENMLIQKRFAVLWPSLEQSAGPHLSKVRAASVAKAERAYQAAPDDHDKLQYYANALRHAGRLDDAVALRAKLPATSAAMAEADERMGWAVNNVGLALHEAGKADDADQLFALLNDAPMPEEFWRVSMKINRLELLVTDGNFERALPLIEPTAKTKGSPYADQLVRRLRYCTLSSLGKKDEAAKALPELLVHAKDAYSPTIDGLLCAGAVDQAEKIALEALGSDKKDQFEEDFVRALQPVLLTSDDPSAWQGRWGELRKRPAIAQAYDRLGRDMPGALLPPKANSVASK